MKVRVQEAVGLGPVMLSLSYTLLPDYTPTLRLTSWLFHLLSHPKPHSLRDTFLVDQIPHLMLPACFSSGRSLTLQLYVCFCSYFMPCSSLAVGLLTAGTESIAVPGTQ